MIQPRRLVALLAVAALLAMCPRLSAQDQAPAPTPADPTAPQPEPQPQPEPEPTLVVRELFVMQVDKFSERANDTLLVASTLNTPFPHHSTKSRRLLLNDNGTYANTPMPLGLISFQGQIQSPMTVKIDLVGDKAQVHDHFPADAQTNDQSITWLNVHQAAETRRAKQLAAGGHWLEVMRESEDRLWIASREPLIKERFMLYDASFSYKPQIGLAMKDQSLTLTTTLAIEQTPILTMLVNHQDKDWSVSTVTGQWTQAELPIDARPQGPGQSAPILKPLLKPLADLLAERGYSEEEIGLALGMVASAGLEKSTISLVCVLPEGEIDRHVQLSFKPVPDRVVRTAILVFTNADPDLSSRIRKLITELGSDQWIKREQAQKDLEAMGQAAIKELQDQRKNPDPEIAFRAQQLLETYDLKVEDDR